MSLENLIQFPNIPVELYETYKRVHNVRASNLDSIATELNRLFVTAKSGNKLSQSILFDFYASINHPTVYKDNITGKRIEQRLSKLFALSTGDEIAKTNPDIKTLMSDDEIELFDPSVLALVCSNYREKGDLFFFNSTINNLYKLSIKSLVVTNKEINFGAFEFKSTIKDIDGLSDLFRIQERNRTIDLTIDDNIIKKIGIGSASQLSQMYKYIDGQGKLDEYFVRFEILLRSVYKDDFLIYIKDNKAFRIYLIANKTFIEITMGSVMSSFSKMRFEGNAMRTANLSDYISNSYLRIEEKITDCIPDFDDIEKLLMDSDHDKLKTFRRFINP